MAFLKWLANRLVLQPTVHPIDPGDKTRLLIATATKDELEIWAETVQVGQSDNQLLLIKFPGTGGRAERSTPQPAQLWPNTSTVVWTVNPFGYGGSGGQATLQRYPEMVEQIYQFAKQQYPDRKIVVYGNSLGSLSALTMTANYQVQGLYLRNPVPIHQLISTRPKYAWTSLGTSRFVAAQIPRELDAVANAGSSTCPCLFVSAEKDRVVPAYYQDLIMQAYSGTWEKFLIPGADHHESIPESLGQHYRTVLESLLRAVVQS